MHRNLKVRCDEMQYVWREPLEMGNRQRRREAFSREPDKAAAIYRRSIEQQPSLISAPNVLTANV
jgi:hypothetical protein